MPTITFRVTAREAAQIRQLARTERLTVSEFLRRRAVAAAGPRAAGEYRIARDSLTGLPMHDGGSAGGGPRLLEAGQSVAGGLSVTYLLDVNALLALGHAAHVHHGRVSRWVVTLSPNQMLATCSITELSFVRIAPQARLSPHVGAARDLLAQIVASMRPPFVRLTDDLGVDSLPSWADIPATITDGHLSALGARRAAQLATLDQGIPDSFLIPV